MGIFLFLSCGGDKKTTVDNGQNPQAVSEKTITYPLLPKELFVKLVHETDYTDYIFHYLPFSISQKDSASIAENFGYFDPRQAEPFEPDCARILARQFWHSNGEIIAEADVYYSDKCKFYLFIEDKKPAYTLQMSSSGDQFFSSVTKRAMDMRKSLEVGGATTGGN